MTDYWKSRINECPSLLKIKLCAFSEGTVESDKTFNAGIYISKCPRYPRYPRCTNKQDSIVTLNKFYGVFFSLECGDIQLQKVGCFTKNDKVFPEMLATNRDTSSKHFTGNKLNWKAFENSIERWNLCFQVILTLTLLNPSFFARVAPRGEGVDNFWNICSIILKFSTRIPWLKLNLLEKRISITTLIFDDVIIFFSKFGTASRAA